MESKPNVNVVVDALVADACKKGIVATADQNKGSDIKKYVCESLAKDAHDFHINEVELKKIHDKQKTMKRRLNLKNL